MKVPFNFGQQFISTGDMTTVNDPAVMNIQALPAGIPNIYQQNLGVILETDNRTAQTLPTALFGGLYQYVQFVSVTGIAAGCLCFWDTLANSGHTKYAVTTVNVLAKNRTCAGVVLNGSMTVNNFGWIQVGGLANVLYKSSPTDTTIGDLVFETSNSTNTADANTLAAATLAQYLVAIGTAYAIPVTAARGLVYLQPGGALAMNE